MIGPIDSAVVERSLRLAVPVVALLAAAPAYALEFDTGNFDIRLDSSVTLGAAVRVEDRAAELVGLANGGSAYSTNGDDGNLAFDSGELVSGGTKLTSDLAIGYGDFGLFVRGSGIYNPVLDQADLFDPADYGAGKEFGAAEMQGKLDEVREHVGLDAVLLDAYVHGTFVVGERQLSVKLGRQALNWGESLLVQNGLNSLLAFDVNRLRVPGYQFEEALRPAGMVWAALDLVENVGVEGFYQFEWQPTLIDASGTFWSTNDFAGIGGTQANLGFGRVGENTPAGVTSQPGAFGVPCLDTVPASPAQDCVPLGSTVPRLPDVEPDDGGQYGGSVSVYVPQLNDMDLTFYGANYHSRLPVISGISRSSPAILPNQTDTAGYFVEYPEDIQLYGVSFNTSVPALDIALQGEYSYKVGQPLQIDDVEVLLAGLGAPSQLNPVPGATLGNQYLRGWRRHDVTQYDIGFTKILGPRFGYDQFTLLGEVGYTRVHGLPRQDVLRYEGPGTYTPGNAATAASQGLPVQTDGYATQSSWGYRLAARLNFASVFNLFTVEPTLVFQHDVNGITPTPITNFVEGRKQVTALVNVDYLLTWAVNMGYTNYFGAGPQNLVSDRDFVELSLKYSF